MKKRPISICQPTVCQGFSPNEARHGHGMGSVMLVALCSNRKRMLSQKDAAKPETSASISNRGMKPSTTPPSHAVHARVSVGCGVR